MFASGARVSEVLRVTAATFDKRVKKEDAARMVQQRYRYVFGIPEPGAKPTFHDVV